MAKKGKIHRRPAPKKKKKTFTKSPIEMERMIRSIVHDIVLPIEQRLNLLFINTQNLKANVIASNTILEKTGVINREEFLKECEDYQKSEFSAASDDGIMDGVFVFSLYNMEN